MFSLVRTTGIFISEALLSTFPVFTPLHRAKKKVMASSKMKVKVSQSAQSCATYS